jgi:chemotaxis protein MotA
MMYVFFRVAKNKGDMALEPHVENPTESAIFSQYPTVLKDHTTLDFLCGYMRLLTLGTNNAIDLEGVMDAEIDGITHEKHAPGAAINGIADGAPALGIVAAVLGVIHTMGAISEPPEVLGHLIGAALVGTFFGVLFSYGFVGPIAACMNGVLEADIEYVKVYKAALLGHMQGYAPQVSVEFARKTLPPHSRPSFAKLDEACGNVTIPT